MEDDVALRRLWVISDDVGGLPDASQAVSEALEESDDNSDTTTSSEASKPTSGRRRLYTNEFKLRIAKSVTPETCVVELARANNIRCSQSIYAWVAQVAKLQVACKSKKKRSEVCLGGQGRPVLCPYSDAVVQWVKEVRRENFPIKTSHVITFIEEEFTAWDANYQATRKPASLYRLGQRMIHRHGFSFRRPNRTVLSSKELAEAQRKFADKTGADVASAYPRSAILSADETGVYYDIDDGRITADKGVKGNAKVLGRRHSYRASVLLLVPAVGAKLRPLIVFKPQPGRIVEEEYAAFPNRAVYAVQESGWMDAPTRQSGFVERLWGGYIADEWPDALSLYVGSLKCHVPDASIGLLKDYGTEVVPLPKNATAVLQPLDVGIMGPFKKRLHSLTLCADVAAMRQGDGKTLCDRLLYRMNRPASEKRKEIAERVINALESISADTVRSAWAKAGL